MKTAQLHLLPSKCSSHTIPMGQPESRLSSPLWLCLQGALGGTPPLISHLPEMVLLASSFLCGSFFPLHTAPPLPALEFCSVRGPPWALLCLHSNSRSLCPASQLYETMNKCEGGGVGCPCCCFEIVSHSTAALERWP